VDEFFKIFHLKSRKKCLIHHSLIHCRHDKFSCWGYVALARNNTREGDACHETYTVNDQAAICAKSSHWCKSGGIAWRRAKVKGLMLTDRVDKDGHPCKWISRPPSQLAISRNEKEVRSWE